MKIINTSNNQIIACRVIIANTFFSRLKGLMFIKCFNKGNAVIITHCNMIHTFFMKIDIDILFISKSNEIVYIIEKMKPGKVSHLITKAAAVIELPEDTVRKTATMVGDIVKLER